MTDKDVVDLANYCTESSFVDLFTFHSDNSAFIKKVFEETGSIDEALGAWSNFLNGLIDENCKFKEN